MPRIPRLLVKREDAVYHIISRTALDGFVLGDEEKEFLLSLIKWLSAVYFTEVFGFCIMGNHFHLLVKMKTGEHFSDEEVLKRIKLYYQDSKRVITKGQIPSFRAKFANLSEYVKDIKQRFSRYYNKKYGRQGYFWGDRFKSVLIEEGAALLNCLAYIDLNPVRAGLVERPEDYRWCSLGYHVQNGNLDGFLSTDFGLKEFGVLSAEKRLRRYRKYVYEKGGIEVEGKGAIKPKFLEQERRRGYKISPWERFRYRTRYFTDAGILGSKEFVKKWYEAFRKYFRSKDKRPQLVPGLAEIYSLKRLLEIRNSPMR